jgi:hypothetical protein
MSLCPRTDFAAHHQLRSVPACRPEPSQSGLYKPQDSSRSVRHRWLYLALPKELFFVLPCFDPLAAYHPLSGTVEQECKRMTKVSALQAPPPLPHYIHPHRPSGFISDRSGLRILLLFRRVHSF